MAEVLSPPPTCSVSVYSNRHMYSSYSRTRDSRINFGCMNCSAYLNWGLKIDMNCDQSHSLEVVAVADNSSSRTPKQRVRKSFMLCGFTSKAASLDFESVCEEKEVLDENGSQNILPPWGGVADQELDGRDHLNAHPKPLEAIDESKDEIYYLEERDEEVLSKRILKLSRVNKVRSALALYRSMVASGLLPNSHACNSLLSCLIRSRRLDDALRVYAFMRSSDTVTGHTYSLVLKAVADGSSREAALRLFEEAESDSKAKKHMDAVVYNTMIAMFGRVDDWVQAKRMWMSLRDNGLVGTAVTYRMLVCIFVRCGQNELALDAYHEMARNGLSPGDDAMQAVIGACAREGKWDTALDVLQSMMNDDLKPSLITCNALINTLGKAAKVELAFRVYDLLKSLGYAPDAYTWNGLLCALNRANRHSDALRLFESIRREHKSVLNLHIYNTCLMSCQRLGLWDRAMQLLWEMEGSGFPVSVTSYNLVIGACEAARKPKVAFQVYKHMVQQKQTTPDVFTLLSLIRSCIWGSLWKDLEEILNAEPNGSLYNAAIQGTCLRNERGLARKLYMRMREIGLKPDGKTRAMMLQSLPRG